MMGADFRNRVADPRPQGIAWIADELDHEAEIDFDGPDHDGRAFCVWCGTSSTTADPRPVIEAHAGECPRCGEPRSLAALATSDYGTCSRCAGEIEGAR